MATQSNKRLVFQILSFLSASLSDGSIRTDDAEGIEIASQCISEAFNVDLTKPEDVAAFALPAGQTLATILDNHVNSTPAAPVAAAKVDTKAPVTAADKTRAEKAKGLGNQKMAAKAYQAAIDAYSEAIAIDATPVYYSNRAAAYSQLQAHEDAISDARTAIELDPSFSKAYSRLGHALFSSGEYAEAVTAYENGLAIDPSNPTMKSSLATARARVASDNADEDESTSLATSRGAPSSPGGMPAGLAGLMGGLGGAGGMPDMAAMMNNPAIMGMAQQMMSNGGMEQLMNNPMLRQMMQGMQNGGGMPDIGALMSDPTLAAMMQGMMGGMGGAAEGSDGNDGPDNMYS